MLKTRAALVPIVALAAAFFLSACGGGETNNINNASSLEAYSETTVSADSSEETNSEAREEPETEASEQAGRWGNERVTDDGVTVLFENFEYTDGEIKYFEDAAEEAADRFCYTVFNYSTAAGSSVTSALSEMLADTDTSFDTPEAFDEVFSGTNMESAYYWYEPAYLFISHDDTYGDCINTFGLTRVHMASDKIPESDFDIFLQLALLKTNDEWKIYYILTGDMYLPGEGSVVCDEDYNWIIDVDIDPVTSFDITNPEGYLTDYMYDRYEGGDGQ